MYRETLAERLKEVWTWYSSFTSLQGLTQYLASKSIQWKQYWFVISIAFSVPTITGVYFVFEDFFLYPVVTNIQSIQNSTIEFPSVTVCNTNRVHCENLLEYVSTCQNQSKCNRETHELLCELFYMTDCEYGVGFSQRFKYGYLKSDLDHCANNYTFETLESEKQIEQRFYEIYLKLEPDDVAAIAHESTSMIKSCEFGGVHEPIACQKLHSASPKTVISPRYGLCYVFNFVLSDELDQIASSNSDGPDYGLSLVIDIEKSQYVRKGLSSKEGLIIALASPSEYPNLLSNPLGLSPNRETNMAISLSQTKLLPKPYTNQCENKYPSIIQPYFDNRTSYLDVSCRRACLNLHIEKNCNCTNPLSFDATDGRVDLSKLKFCSVDYKSPERDCVKEVIVEFGANKTDLPCGCGLDCESNNFMVTTSSTVWPSDQYWGSLAEKYEVQFNGSTVTYHEARDAETVHGLTHKLFQKIKEQISTNYLKVNIYFETLAIQRTYESPKYSFNSFLSTLGGALSLYQGLTILSLFEFFELMFRFTYAAFRK